MKTNDFLQRLLESQNLEEGDLKTLKAHREEVEGLLRAEYLEEPIIKYAGSKAKRTMIKESYDLDIICYFPRDCEIETIEEIYNDVKEKLSTSFTIDPKPSALRISKVEDSTKSDYHIDVVPGRFIDEKNEDAFLYYSKAEGKRIQTNLKKHIEYIGGSGSTEVIRLMKLWKVRNNLKIKTFAFELITVRALKGYKDKDNLAKALIKVLESIRDEINDMRLEDPANSNNAISDQLEESDKQSVLLMAKSHLALLEDDEDNVDKWKTIFRHVDKSASISVGSIGVPTSKPWTYKCHAN